MGLIPDVLNTVGASQDVRSAAYDAGAGRCSKTSLLCESISSTVSMTYSYRPNPAQVSQHIKAKYTGHPGSNFKGVLQVSLCLLEWSPNEVLSTLRESENLRPKEKSVCHTYFV